MKSILIFDAETQHYRQSIYKYFAKEFLSKGYKLTIVYDCQLNTIENCVDGLFIGIKYSFQNFRKIIKEFDCKLVISFVWLRYKFLLPFLGYCRFSKIRTIVWSHGINLQKRKQPLKNQLYFLRQHLANALIIFSEEQIQYIRAARKKLFIANNTLNFYELPTVVDSKEFLKKKYNFNDQKVILCVGRMNVNNRNPEDLIDLAKMLDSNHKIIIIGPGVKNEHVSLIEEVENIEYLGGIYDQKVVSEYYKLSDLFVMPGAIGLAINQAQYFSTPCVVKNVPQGPEAYYLKEGSNGYYYEPGNIVDLYQKVSMVMDKSRYDDFCKQSLLTTTNEGSIERMFDGFLQAIRYVEVN